MEWRLAARTQGIFTEGCRPFDSVAVDRRQRSAEALNRTGEEGEDGVGCADHEVSGTAGVSTLRSSMTIKRPSLQMGQQWGSSTLVVVSSVSTEISGTEAASSVRH